MFGLSLMFLFSVGTITSPQIFMPLQNLIADLDGPNYYSVFMANK
jgi:hypothetical protein